MAIERWHPFTELMSLRQAMDKLFEDSFVRPSRALAALGEVTYQPSTSTRHPTTFSILVVVTTSAMVK